jgi:hypothetical protein
MFLGSWILALAIIAVFLSAGIFPGPFSIYLIPLTLIALAATLVESLPIADLDNLTITATALIMGHLLL